MKISRHVRPALAAFACASLLAPLASAQALKPAALFPANGAANLPPDAHLRITFNAPPSLGTGNIRIIDASTGQAVETIDVSAPPAPTPPPAPAGSTAPAPQPRPMVRAPIRTATLDGVSQRYYPVLIDGNEVDITPNSAFANGKSYYITIDAGALTSAAGESFSGFSDDKAWRFSTRAAEPAPGKTSLTVSADGVADYCTVQGAIDYVPAGNATPTTIHIKNGTYREIVAFSGKNALTFLGENRKQTILAYPNNNAFSRGRRGTFMTRNCNDLTLANLTLHNTTPRGGSQAETIILSGSPTTAHMLITACNFISTQDTIQVNGQAYLSDCYIEGDVDFMWGTGPVFFENCICKSTRSKGYFTQIRNRATNHGYIYSHCTFEGADGITDNVLSRIVPQQFPTSEVVLIDCTLTSAVSPKGWLLDKGATDPKDIHFWEFNSRTPDGQPVDVAGRIPASKQLKQPDDAETIKNYSNPTWVLGGWTPKIPDEVAATIRSSR
jgi:pectin methylesterase-like acyl-CoA thioesterase